MKDKDYDKIYNLGEKAGMRKVAGWVMEHSSKPSRSALDPSVINFTMHMSQEIWQKQLKEWDIL